jgi:thiol-disulfide isomerase/thioredoxin
VGYLSRLLRRYGGMITAPRQTLRAIGAGQGGDPLEGVLLFVWVQLWIAGRVLYRNLMLSSEAPEVSFRRSYEAVWNLSRNDVMLFFVVAFALVVLGRVGARFAPFERRSARAMAAVAGYLLLPVVALKVAGGVTMWLGADQWWLPHHPIDSYVVVVDRRIDWTRFALKCVVAYGPSALLLLDFVLATLRGRAPPERDEPARAPSGRALVAGGAVVALCVLTAAGSSADIAAQAERLRPALPGDPLPDTKLPWLDPAHTQGAKSFTPKSYEGKVLLLDFWASWCKPCRKAMPELSALQKELGEQGLVVVGVNREPYARKKGRTAYRDLAPDFPSALDTRGYGEKLGLTSLPTSYIIDKKGVLRHLHLGYTEPETVRAEVEALLAE